MQTPIGRLSDRLDRRWVISGTALAALTLSVLLFILDLREPAAVIVMVVALGGAMHTLYPLAVAHANDRAQEGEFVTISSGLLLVFGIGATLGPAIAAPLMQFIAPSALFLFLASVYSIIALYALWRITQRSPVAEEESLPAFTGLEAMQGAIQGATQETMHLDPRAEDETPPVDH